MFKKDLIMQYVLNETLNDENFTFTIKKMTPKVDVGLSYCRDIVHDLVDCGVLEIVRRVGTKRIFRLKPKYVLDIMYDFINHYAGDHI